MIYNLWKSIKKLNIKKDKKIFLRNNVGKTFVYIHQNVKIISDKYLQELRKYNYVTPTIYLDFIETFKRLYKKKNTNNISTFIFFLIKNKEKFSNFFNV